MEEIKTVNDLIRAKNLSIDEEKQLRDIIDECRMRELKIKESTEAAKQNLESLGRTFGMIVDAIGAVGHSVDELHREVEQLQLRLMPEDQFFRE